MNRRQWLHRSGAALAGALALPRLLAAEPLYTLRADAPDDIRARLHSNENPYGPYPSAREAMMEAFDAGCRYPSSAYPELTGLIAEHEGLSPEHVVLGAGSHEILRVCAMAYGLEGGEILTPYPTFEGLEAYAHTIGAEVHRVPLTEDFLLDLEEMDRRTTQAIRLVFVCNPNNPTGTIVPADTLRDFCRSMSRRTPVLVDEAYHEYVQHRDYASMADLIREGENVIVSRTFSKIFGLAGLRVGYALARPDIAARLRRYTTRHTVNILGLKAAIASYRDGTRQAFSRQKNAEARAFLYETFDRHHLRYLPSETNFVFFHLGFPVERFRSAMRERGILVGRPFPPYLDWCRVSTATMEEMRLFAEALPEVLEVARSASNG